MKNKSESRVVQTHQLKKMVGEYFLSIVIQ